MYVNITLTSVILLISHPCGSIALQESKAPSDDDEAPRRHSNDESRLVHSSQPFRTLFFGAVTAALAVVRLKLRLAKRLKVEVKVEIGVEIVGSGDTRATLATPVCVLRPRCGGSYCAYALLNGPLVVRQLPHRFLLVNVKVEHCYDTDIGVVMF
jgi:hypothetical protein